MAPTIRHLSEIFVYAIKRPIPIWKLYNIEESKHQRDQRDNKRDCDAIFNDSQSVRTYSIKISEDEFKIITSENSETSEI